MQADPASEPLAIDDEMRAFLARLRRVTEELEAALSDAQAFSRRDVERQAA